MSKRDVDGAAEIAADKTTDIAVTEEAEIAVTETAEIAADESIEIAVNGAAELAANKSTEIAVTGATELATDKTTEIAVTGTTELAADNTTEIATAGTNDLAFADSKELSDIVMEADPMASAIDIPFVDVDENDDGKTDEGGKAKRQHSILKRAVLGLAILLVAVTGVIVLDILADTGLFIKPPEVNPDPRPGNVVQPVDPMPPAQPTIKPGDDDASVVTSIRNYDKFTFLVLGLDDGEYNTDVIMIVAFDTVTKMVDVVNIPRDTMVNVDWGIKKANSILPYMRLKFRSTSDSSSREEEAMNETVKMFADVLGFEVDFWVTVNMKGFAALVDAIGGVDFNVPVNMEYHDNFGDLHISYKKGMNRGLSGKQALEILRFRSYGSADIGRINTQQLFLTAVIDQMMAKKSSLNVTSLADMFFKNVRTNIPLNNLAWFGLRFLEISTDDINFGVLPGDNLDNVGGQSYVTIYVEEWLEIVNTKLSPLYIDITETDVSILTRGTDRKLYVTDGNWVADPNWGSGSRGTSQSQPSRSGSGSSSGTSSGSSSGSSGAGSSTSSATEGDEPTGQPEGDEQAGEQQTTDVPPDNIPLDGEQPQPAEPAEPPTTIETPRE